MSAQSLLTTSSHLFFNTSYSAHILPFSSSTLSFMTPFTSRRPISGLFPYIVMCLRRRRDNVVVKCRLFIVDVVVVVVDGGRPMSCRPADLLWRWTRLFITRRAEQLPSRSIRPCRNIFIPNVFPSDYPHQTLSYSTHRTTPPRSVHQPVRTAA